MEFIKVHGLGNDFILLEPTAYAGHDLSELAIKLCDRHTGIGADGLLLIAPASNKTADICMRIINQDGTEAEMCGNGIRCFSRYAYEKGIVDAADFRVETKAGIIVPHVIVEKDKVKAVRIDMGQAFLERVKIPMKGSGKYVLAEELSLADGSCYEISSVLMGVPHTMIFVDALSDELVNTIGPKIENHPSFPQGTNVNFVVVHNRKEIEVRTWERGAGATLACGTGCCAAVVASSLNGYTDREVTVHVQLGNLQIQYRDEGTVWMTGPASIMFHGEWNED